ncbi:MAG: 2-succinyl-5-enolpyruvyl-6-hydroxy-3-cyclohexene-1-carboxylic-acid synthase, partial [Cyanobacteriota bacterium]|nr:2-succinyl-5-enolpyruvyl-6-hydroxy-3-cyclohexene-1-carboxylic-acid synthase [Cyanobacteriota bacterium]
MLAAAWLLHGLARRGTGPLVVCPGSRSGPLAVAAGLLEPLGLGLFTAIDERSAAFFALGLARAAGRPAAVVVTSGTAVAQLLAATVEADLGTIPLLLVSADRPARLKGCGANQSVNQDTFLAAHCRWFGQGDGAGLGRMDPAALERLAATAAAALVGDGGQPPGPVHLNLPFEEPLHADAPGLAWLRDALAGWPALPAAGPQAIPPATGGLALPAAARLDPDRPGVVVAGPWRGQPQRWADHLDALRRWQRRTGWPLLADALSGLRGLGGLDLVASYDLLLDGPDGRLAVDQVLRLGPLPASRRLQAWLDAGPAAQVLVSEGDPRPLDPLARVRAQVPGGLAAWVAACLGPADPTPPQPPSQPEPQPQPSVAAWRQAEAAIQHLLGQELGGGGPAAGPPAADLNEPWLARWLSRQLPPGLPLMLANSSPVRDWESFADPAPAHRPVFSFRGASGIDGTLSIACGLADALGTLVLVCGDLALLHDGNGWLWPHQMRGRLTILLLDNGGGGIFEQLPIRTDPASSLDFERLFAMPQPVDACALAAAHGMPARTVSQPAGLESALHWALGQPCALLRLCTDRRADAGLRRRLRTMAAQALAA